MLRNIKNRTLALKEFFKIYFTVLRFTYNPKPKYVSIIKIFLYITHRLPWVLNIFHEWMLTKLWISWILGTHLYKNLYKILCEHNAWNILYHGQATNSGNGEGEREMKEKRVQMVMGIKDRLEENAFLNLRNTLNV